MLDSPGYGYVNAGVRCDERKKVLYLMATLVSRFTIFRRSSIPLYYAREYNAGNRDPFTHRWT